jgi:hypothetical protein
MESLWANFVSHSMCKYTRMQLRKHSPQIMNVRERKHLVYTNSEAQSRPNVGRNTSTAIRIGKAVTMCFHFNLLIVVHSINSSSVCVGYHSKIATHFKRRQQQKVFRFHTVIILCECR